MSRQSATNVCSLQPLAKLFKHECWSRVTAHLRQFQSLPGIWATWHWLGPSSRHILYHVYIWVRLHAGICLYKKFTCFDTRLVTSILHTMHSKLCLATAGRPSTSSSSIGYPNLLYKQACLMMSHHNTLKHQPLQHRLIYLVVGCSICCIPGHGFFRAGSCTAGGRGIILAEPQRVLRISGALYAIQNKPCPRSSGRLSLERIGPPVWNGKYPVGMA